MDAYLLHHLIAAQAARCPAAPALKSGDAVLDYSALWHAVGAFAMGLAHLGLGRSERVAIYLDKRPEAVVASFGTSAAGGVFVPLNPLLRPEQVAYILRDCNVRVLVTSSERYTLLADALAACPDLRHLVLTDQGRGNATTGSVAIHLWQDLQHGKASFHRHTDGDMAAILYTSGSTGQPKGVVLSHHNLVAGARSVVAYLGNTPEDRLLAVLPLSFDAGFSQLTTAFAAGASVVLLNYLLPRDVLKIMAREHITGLTAVPPLWIQLAGLDWPAPVSEHLRYFASTGGVMPPETLAALRKHCPKAKPYLMYGLTEAFRATYLSPDEVDRRPDSIGKAIPNNEVFVLRDNGEPCAANEPGELVQRGPLVALGYWNDAARTADRFRPLPAALRPVGLTLPEIAVYSGDTVRMDEEGFLYFVGRRDEMIKTSGYRVSPNEIEEAAYASALVAECCAFGVPHPVLGQAIVLIACPAGPRLDSSALLEQLRQRCPAYQIPARIIAAQDTLPRNSNGKIDRKLLAEQYANVLQENQ